MDLVVPEARPGGPLRLSHNISIQGPGPSDLTITRSTFPFTPRFGIFQVDANQAVTISGVTITAGTAQSGGSILNSGTLTVVVGTLITGNSATFGGGIANSGTLTVSGGTVISGDSANVGGGIGNSAGATVTSTTVRSRATSTRPRRRSTAARSAGTPPARTVAASRTRGI